MPDVEEKTVDIDTSGPDVDIKLPEEKKPETEIEVQDEKTIQDSPKSDDTPKKLDEQLDVRDSKDSEEPVQEKKEEVKKET